MATLKNSEISRPLIEHLRTIVTLELETVAELNSKEMSVVEGSRGNIVITGGGSGSSNSPFTFN